MKKILNYEKPELDVKKLENSDAIVMSGDEYVDDTHESAPWYDL